MRTFCGPACNMPCQLPAIFWACNPLPSNAARAIIHNVAFFIGDLLLRPLVNKDDVTDALAQQPVATPQRGLSRYPAHPLARLVE
jgi:hypothetical protein